MNKTKNQQKLHGFVILYLFLGLGVLVLGNLRGEMTLKGYQELEASKDRLAAITEELKEENEKIKRDIHLLKTSKSYALFVLKDKYHYTEEGEEILFFADD